MVTRKRPRRNAARRKSPRAVETAEDAQPEAEVEAEAEETPAVTKRRSARSTSRATTPVKRAAKTKAKPTRASARKRRTKRDKDPSDAPTEDDHSKHPSDSEVLEDDDAVTKDGGEDSSKESDGDQSGEDSKHEEHSDDAREADDEKDDTRNEEVKEEDSSEAVDDVKDAVQENKPRTKRIRRKTQKLIEAESIKKGIEPQKVESSTDDDAEEKGKPKTTRKKRNAKKSDGAESNSEDEEAGTDDEKPNDKPKARRKRKRPTENDDTESSNAADQEDEKEDDGSSEDTEGDADDKEEKEKEKTRRAIRKTPWSDPVSAMVDQDEDGEGADSSDDGGDGDIGMGATDEKNKPKTKRGRRQARAIDDALPAPANEDKEEGDEGAASSEDSDDVAEATDNKKAKPKTKRGRPKAKKVDDAVPAKADQGEDEGEKSAGSSEGDDNGNVGATDNKKSKRKAKRGRPKAQKVDDAVPATADQGEDEDEKRAGSIEVDDSGNAGATDKKSKPKAKRGRPKAQKVDDALPATDEDEKSAGSSEGDDNGNVGATDNKKAKPKTKRGRPKAKKVDDAVPAKADQGEDEGEKSAGSSEGNDNGNIGATDNKTSNPKTKRGRSKTQKVDDAVPATANQGEDEDEKSAGSIEVDDDGDVDIGTSRKNSKPKIRRGRRKVQAIDDAVSATADEDKGEGENGAGSSKYSDDDDDAETTVKKSEPNSKQGRQKTQRIDDAVSVTADQDEDEDKKGAGSSEDDGNDDVVGATEEQSKPNTRRGRRKVLANDDPKTTGQDEDKVENVKDGGNDNNNAAAIEGEGSRPGTGQEGQKADAFSSAADQDEDINEKSLDLREGGDDTGDVTEATEEQSKPKVGRERQKAPEIDDALSSAPDQDEVKDGKDAGLSEGDDDDDADSTGEKDRTKIISSNEGALRSGDAAQTGSPRLVGTMNKSSPEDVPETRKVEKTSQRKDLDAIEEPTESDHAALDKVSEMEDNSQVNIAEAVIMKAEQVHDPHAESSPEGGNEEIANKSTPPSTAAQSYAESAARDVSDDLRPNSTEHNVSSTNADFSEEVSPLTTLEGESGNRETEGLLPEEDEVEGNATSILGDTPEPPAEIRAVSRDDVGTSQADAMVKLIEACDIAAAKSVQQKDTDSHEANDILPMGIGEASVPGDADAPVAGLYKENADAIVEVHGGVLVEGNIDALDERHSDVPVEGNTDVIVDGHADVPVEGNTDVIVQGRADVPVEGNTDVPVEENADIDIFPKAAATASSTAKEPSQPTKDRIGDDPTPLASGSTLTVSTATDRPSPSLSGQHEDDNEARPDHDVQTSFECEEPVKATQERKRPHEDRDLTAATEQPGYVAESLLKSELGIQTSLGSEGPVESNKKQPREGLDPTAASEQQGNETEGLPKVELSNQTSLEYEEPVKITSESQQLHDDQDPTAASVQPGDVSESYLKPELGIQSFLGSEEPVKATSDRNRPHEDIDPNAASEQHGGVTESLPETDLGIAAADQQGSATEKNIPKTEFDIAAADQQGSAMEEEEDIPKTELGIAAADQQGSATDENIPKTELGIAAADQQGSATDESIPKTELGIAAADQQGSATDENIPKTELGIAAADQQGSATDENILKTELGIAATDQQGDATESLSGAELGIAATDQQGSATDENIPKTELGIAATDHQEDATETLSVAADEQQGGVIESLPKVDLGIQTSLGYDEPIKNTSERERRHENMYPNAADEEEGDVTESLPKIDLGIQSSLEYEEAVKATAERKRSHEDIDPRAAVEQQEDVADGLDRREKHRTNAVTLEFSRSEHGRHESKDVAVDEEGGMDGLPSRKKRRSNSIALRAWTAEKAHSNNGDSVSTIVSKKPPIPEKPLLSLDRIKVMLFSEGSLVHRDSGYERVFAQYWDALSLRLEGQLSAANAEKCRSALGSFLKTRRLKKLHNQLVMGLLERCVRPTSMLADISHNIPDSWRKRVIVLSKAPVDACITAHRGDMQTQADENAEGLDEVLVPQYCTPAISEPYMPPPTARPNAGGSASRIPGAIAIDPNVRARAHQLGMKVSENAVWLLVAAAKEYADSVLKSVIASVKAIDAGQVPVRNPKHQITRRMKVSPTKNGISPVESTLPSKMIRCITATEVHALTARMHTGAVLSLGGSVSRLSFERSLFSSLDMSAATVVNSSDEVRQFITSELLSSIEAKPASIQMNETKVGIPMTQNSETSRSDAPAEGQKRLSAARNIVPRPPIGGMGRGAKDLAALKARASVTSKDNVGGPVAAAQSLPSEPSPTVPPPEASTSATEPLPVENPGVQNGVTTDDEERRSLQSRPPMPKHQPVGVSRKGKGFGVKNLRAMMARSTSEKKAEDGATDEAAEKGEDTPTSTVAIDEEAVGKSETQLQFEPPKADVGRKVRESY